MRYMFVNADKREYVRLVDLGAPHGSKYFELTQYLGPADWQWTILLAQLLELTTPHERSGLVVPCPLRWAGDRVFILRGDEESGVTMPEGERALKALGADFPHDYAYVREHYTDRTMDLKAWWPKTQWGQDSRYGLITQPPDYSWLKPDEALRNLDWAQAKGAEFYQGYLKWLRHRPKVRPEVREILRQRRKALKDAEKARTVPACPAPPAVPSAGMTV